jgi:uncharacterized protein involved in outer membrane biogenesis
MRRVLQISGIVAAVCVLVTAYAVYNLNAVITYDQQRILNRVSQALGRKVNVGQIQARLRLGLAIEASDVKVADDPAFSHEPFLSAAMVSLDVQFVPLLSGNVKIQSLELLNPKIRILRNDDRKLNVGSLGADVSEEAPQVKPGSASAIRGMIWDIARDATIKGLEPKMGPFTTATPCSRERRCKLAI